MSLVNDMLRDLQKRNAHAAEPLQGIVAVDKQKAAVTRFLSPSRLLMILTVLGGAFLGYGGYFEKSNRWQSPLAEVQKDQPDPGSDSTAQGFDARAASDESLTDVVKPDQVPVAVARLASLSRYRLDYRLADPPRPAGGAASARGTRDPVRARDTAENQPADRDNSKLLPGRVTALTLARALDQVDYTSKKTVGSRVASLRQTGQSLPQPIAAETPVATGQKATPGVARQTTVGESIRKPRVDQPARLRREGLAALSAQRPREAERLFRLLIDSASNHAESYLLLHRALTAQSRAPEASAVLYGALSVVDSPDAIASLLAHSLLSQERPEEAQKLLETHRPAAQDNDDYDALLAAVYQRNQLHGQAIAVYSQLLARIPTNGAWWIGLAISNEALGSRGAAINAFRQAQATVGTDPTLMRYAARRLTSLEAES